jgi:hypothetical protein
VTGFSSFFHSLLTTFHTTMNFSSKYSLQNFFCANIGAIVLACTTLTTFATFSALTSTAMHAQSAQSAQSTTSSTAPSKPARVLNLSDVPPAMRNLDDYAIVPVNFSLFPSASISDAVRAATGKKVANIVSVGFVTSADRLLGFDGSILSSHYGDVFGLQGSLLATTAAGEVSGFQGSFVVNVAGGNVAGAQSAGVVNVASGEVIGAQGAGVVNVASGGVIGIQGAGVLNVTKNLSGAQGAGVLNVADTVAGVQAAGVANFAGAMSGVQAAGLWNSAGVMDGVQMAGILNTASAMNGFHVGLLNFADSGSGVAIGLLSVVRSEGVKVQVWGDEMGFAHLTLRTGTHNVANYIGLGRQLASPQGSGLWAFTYGLGVELDLAPRLSTTIDALAMTVVRENSFSSGVVFNRASDFAQMYKLRATLGWEPFDGLRLFGGVAMSFFFSNTTTGDDFIRWSVYDAVTSRGTVYRAAPGLVFGVQFF